MMRPSVKNAILAPVFVASIAILAAPLAANADPMVGGAAMYASKNIIQNAVNSKEHTTLVAAVKAAGLVKTLEGPGPFTVFAPTNAAFDKLPPGAVKGLLKPENKSKLTSILEYHVVPGKLTTQDIQDKIKEGNGKAMLKTVEGSDLIAEDDNGHIELLGANNSHAEITISNVDQSNGEIQVINGVLMP